MEGHDAGFPPFPRSLRIPSGFPHSHGLDDGTRGSPVRRLTSIVDHGWSNSLLRHDILQKC